jgi:cobalamin synthase
VNLQEKSLYHQIHPLKLATDIGTTPISLYLFWQHELIWALVITIIPSILASFLLVRYANLEPYKQSAFGRYIARYMSSVVVALRVLGLIVMIVGAWNHIGWLIPLGLVIIVLAWMRGLLIQQRLRRQLYACASARFSARGHHPR